MRYWLLLSFLLPTLGLFAGEANRTLYVWATSGLTLRDAGIPEGARIGALPYGSAVTALAEYGAEISVPIVKAGTIGDRPTRAFALRDRYRKVRTPSGDGFVFAAYLLPYPPPPRQLREDGTCCFLETSLGEWLGEQVGKADTLRDAYDQVEGSYFHHSLYPDGTIKKLAEREGGGATEWLFSALNFNQVFVLANCFYDLTNDVPAGPQEVDLQYVVQKADAAEVVFLFEDGVYDQVTIRRVGTFVYLKSEGGC